MSSPPTSWRFAETKIGKPIIPEGDTGDVYRAMLPIENTALRTSLESWKGPALVANLRTICGAPTMIDPAIEFIKDLNRTTGLQINSLTGTFKAGAYTLNKTERLFCEIDVDWRTKLPNSWPISICADQGALPEAYFRGLRDSVSNLHHRLNQVILVNSSAQALNLLQKAQSAEDVTESIGDDLARDLTQIQDGLWTKLNYPDGSNVLSVTTCYINMLTPWVYDVTMRGKRMGTELVGNWSSINQNGDNTDILHQLGVGLDPTEFQKRGILSLDINLPASYLPSRDGGYNGLLGTVMSQHHPQSQSAWSLWHERHRNNWENAWSTHAAHASIFQAIIQETKDPAMAVQALFFRMYQMLYYDWLREFDILEDVETTYSTEVPIPIRWTGLVIIAGLIGTHIAVTITTFCLFALKTQTSTPGNVWPVLAQMISPETVLIIEKAHDMRDKDVKDWAKTNGLHVRLYGISRSKEIGRVELRCLE